VRSAGSRRRVRPLRLQPALGTGQRYIEPASLVADGGRGALQSFRNRSNASPRSRQSPQPSFVLRGPGLRELHLPFASAPAPKGGGLPDQNSRCCDITYREHRQHQRDPHPPRRRRLHDLAPSPLPFKRNRWSRAIADALRIRFPRWPVSEALRAKTHQRPSLSHWTL
jgi:hypothetical protein